MKNKLTQLLASLMLATLACSPVWAQSAGGNNNGSTFIGANNSQFTGANKGENAVQYNSGTAARNAAGECDSACGASGLSLEAMDVPGNYSTIVIPDPAATPVITTETRTSMCATGQSGSITETRTVTNGVPGAWTQTSNTCMSNCVPLGNQTQSVSCPSNQVGTISQTRASTCPTTSGSPVWSGWTTTANNCVNKCVALAPRTQNIACPTGQTGTITQTSTSSCPTQTGAPVWGGWTTTGNTCKTITAPAAVANGILYVGLMNPVSVMNGQSPLYDLPITGMKFKVNGNYINIPTFNNAATLPALVSAMNSSFSSQGLAGYSAAIGPQYTEYFTNPNTGALITVKNSSIVIKYTPNPKPTLGMVSGGVDGGWSTNGGTGPQSGIFTTMSKTPIFTAAMQAGL